MGLDSTSIAALSLFGGTTEMVSTSVIYQTVMSLSTGKSTDGDSSDDTVASIIVQSPHVHTCCGFFCPAGEPNTRLRPLPIVVVTLEVDF